MAERGERSRFLSFAELSALFVVFAGATYLLGVVALVVPIATNYTHDFPTAWYAVSVVPNIALAGHGVSRLLATPITMLFGFAIPIVFRMLTYWLFENRSDVFLKVVYWISVISTFALIWLLWRVYIFAEPNFRRIIPGDIYLFFVSAGLAAFPPKGWLGLEFRRGNLVPKIASKSKVFLIVAALFLLSSAASFSFLVFEPPELPRVKIMTTGTTSTVKGALVTHTERFWYLFNIEGELVAIPDDKVRVVRFPTESN